MSTSGDQRESDDDESRGQSPPGLTDDRASPPPPPQPMVNAMSTLPHPAVRPSLQTLARHAETLANFASGLAQDNKCPQLLAGLIEAAMKSPFRASLEPMYRQLKAMQLDKSPFVICSVIGQELLNAEV